jgi:energy-coupling factor transporter ATP-binding protein EcfA2
MICASRRQSPGLAILYGDNGSGKTTVLRTVFHLLSGSDGRGHRNALAETEFREFSVELLNGTTISAARPQVSRGAYSLHFRKPGAEAISGQVDVDSNGFVNAKSMSAEAHQVTKRIRETLPPVFFLGDDRQLLSDWISPNQFDDDELEIDFMQTAVGSVRRPVISTRRRGRFDNRDRALVSSVHACAGWLRYQAFQAASRGEMGVVQIYSEVLRGFADSGVPEATQPALEREALARSLAELENRVRQFSSFGLAPEVNTTPLVEALQVMGNEALPFASQAVRSFVDGQDARLTALQRLRDTISKFESTVNRDFFVGKAIQLRVEQGLTIVTTRARRMVLEPTQLSSGEKHLLLLLLNVLMNREHSPLFVIDEPELSLNVKWQRNFVDSVLDLSSGTDTQFVLASHSVELLACHPNSVIPLAECIALKGSPNEDSSDSQPTGGNSGQDPT